MKPKILFLTNKNNDSAEEDILLADLLKTDFELIVAHPRASAELISSVRGVIIRNIWPTYEYGEEWENIKNYLRRSLLPIYNPLIFTGDIEGKDYLVDLSQKGYPVIPSVDTTRDLGQLPDANFYWMKPKNSCDGIGAKKVSKDELLKIDPKGYIIQPFVEFSYEVSFFFVDNIYSHSISEINRLSADTVSEYLPTKSDLEFARLFVRWSGLPFGIQRIDALQSADKKLYLTEIENLCPYLYINEVEKGVRNRFLSDIRLSMLRVFK